MTFCDIPVLPFVYVVSYVVCIVASEPSCFVNISLPGHAVHESDFLQINCTIEYKGSWMPVINCAPEVPVQLVADTYLSFDRVSYIGLIAAADIADWTVISCETRFVLPKSDTPVSDRFERVLDTPRYHHTWRTSPIRVFNTTGNTHRTGRFIIKVSAAMF